MNDEFDIIEAQSKFDIKAFLLKAISYWKLFLICLIIGLVVIYQQNIRKQQSYRLSTQISVEDDNNPLFTSNTSLVFNWGGVSNKVKTMITSLRSRSNHEKVVDNLDFYITYLKQSRFRKDDIYKDAPFRIKLISSTNQLINIPIKIIFLSDNTFNLEINFETNLVRIQNFSNKKKSSLSVSIGQLKKQYTLGETITLPYLNCTINLEENRKVNIGEEYFFKFDDFDVVVAKYKSKFNISNAKNSSILNLSLTDFNKTKIVDYLNETVRVLSEDQLNRKNQFVTNTIKFIDEQLDRVKQNLVVNADSLNKYREQNKIFNLDEESVNINTKLTSLEFDKDNINRKLAYYSSLKTYLETSNKFTEVPAPSIAGIDDGNILTNIGKINGLSVEKSKLEYSVRSDTSIFNDLNRQIEGLKTVLLENISSATSGLRRELVSINSKIAVADSKIRKLPKEQQKLITIQRQYSLSEQTYNVFLGKRSEAEIIKSASVSDVLIIDKAKDTGVDPIDLNLNSRYVFALFGGLFPTLLLAFLMVMLDTKLHNPESLKSISKIPLLGVIGKNSNNNNLAVFTKPKSSISESFRAIRSSLQYIYKKHNVKGSKTVMVTSSVSGEGKTFCSINIATVFALSGKKTVLVGLDLRKPKIFGDFDIKNNIGSVNYLIGQKTLAEITQPTKIVNLSVITSGPIPPNPSELLISDTMDKFMDELKEIYDYIILDTPPIGLVADALELLEYADASLYVVRQNYTKKPMINFVNDKYKKGEISNISFLYNFYNLKSKYGYGYGYGYGAYGNGYHENDKIEQSFLTRIKSFFKII